LAKRSNLQLKILKELASPRITFSSYLRPTYSSIAKKLEIDEETVRVNVREAQRDGIIVGWYVDINPRVFGRETSIVVLEAGDLQSKDLMINQVRSIPGVMQIVDCYERPLRVDFYYENDTQRDSKLDLIKSICGDNSPVYWQRALPPINMKLKRTDWEILKSLRRDPMLSNEQVGNEIGVSSRTVKRRISLLTQEKVIHSRPVGDIKRFPGHVYLLIVNCADERKKRHIDELVLSRLEKAVFVDIRHKQFSNFSAVFQSMGEAEEMYQWIKSLDGGENTKIYLEQQIIQVYDWINNEIDNRIKETA
jgi:DNA-binding Lrp family transcriptional regulator